MKITKKVVRQLKGPKPGSVLFRRQQIENERRKTEQIERMIEAKVDLALRRLLH